MGVDIPDRVADAALGDDRRWSVNSVLCVRGIADEIEGAGLGPVICDPSGSPTIGWLNIGDFLILHEVRVVHRIDGLVPCVSAKRNVLVPILVVFRIGLCHDTVVSPLEENLLQRLFDNSLGTRGEDHPKRACNI